MNIAIIGAGNVGGTLGKRFGEQGHQVIFATDHPESSKGETSVGAAAKGAEIILLAVPYSAVDDAIANCGNLTGKIVIDCTNTIAPDFSGVTEIKEGSGGQHVAAMTKPAKVVKAFNTIGVNVMATPELHYGRATLF